MHESSRTTSERFRLTKISSKSMPENSDVESALGELYTATGNYAQAGPVVQASGSRSEKHQGTLADGRGGNCKRQSASGVRALK